MSNASQFPARVSDIAGIIENPDRGVISLVGDHGGTALITGEISSSSLMMGLLAIETEHGTLFLDPDTEVTLQEEQPSDSDHEWLVTWRIDSYASTPEAAAARVWTQNFGRNSAGGEDACVFVVTDPKTGVAVTIDLEDYDLDQLLT